MTQLSGHDGDGLMVGLNDLSCLSHLSDSITARHKEEPRDWLALLNCGHHGQFKFMIPRLGQMVQKPTQVAKYVLETIVSFVLKQGEGRAFFTGQENFQLAASLIRDLKLFTTSPTAETQEETVALKCVSALDTLGYFLS